MTTTPTPRNGLGQTAEEARAARDAAWLEKIRNDPGVRAMADAFLPFSSNVEAPPAESLPAILDASEFLAERIAAPPELIVGILHQGSKLSYGGGSKSFKTWGLLDMGLSVAYGAPWLGFPTNKGRVLYINLEIQPAFVPRRIAAILKARNLPALAKGAFDIWNLRGYAASYTTLLPLILERVRNDHYALFVFDPIYKMYGGANENAANEVAQMLNKIEGLAVESGGAVAYGAHFSKGNQASKESIDRVSGSGVFARDPDSILTFTQHEHDGAFVVEPTLRNFPPIKPFVVRWRHPLMVRDTALDPGKLRPSAGRPIKATSNDILALLAGGKRLTTAQWAKSAMEDGGVSRATFYRLLRQAKSDGALKENDGLWHLKPPLVLDSFLS